MAKQNDTIEKGEAEAALKRQRQEEEARRAAQEKQLAGVPKTRTVGPDTREVKSADEAREEAGGVEETYEVSGEQPVYGHQPGAHFEAVLAPAERARKIAQGAIRPVSGGVEYASDAAEEKAKELDVEESRIKATGSGGKVTVADVEAAAEAQTSPD